MARLERLCRPSLAGTPTAGFAGLRGRALKRASKCAPGAFVELGAAPPSSASAPRQTIHKKAPLVRGYFMDGAPGEIRTPDRLVRSYRNDW